MREAGTIVILVVSMVTGCSALPGTSAAPPPTANPWLADDRIAQAIDLRTRFGLRADETWVRLVAEMPEAIAPPLLYEIPLTPQERLLLERRTSNLDDILRVVSEYGIEHPHEWAGAWKDPRSGSVRARFKGDVRRHEAALRRLVATNANLIVIPSDWSLLELHAVEERIVADTIEESWLREHGIAGRALGVDVVSNQVEFEVSSTRTDLDAFLEARYDAVGMLTIISDGNGVLLMPRGDLAGRVVDAQGQPIAGAYLLLRSDVVGAGPGGDMGYGTNSDGRFLFSNIQAVTYTVVVYDGDNPQGPELGASDPVTVVEGERTTILITIR